jgi:predicted dehydrogenase
MVADTLQPRQKLNLDHPMRRRTFLKTTAVAASATLVSRLVSSTWAQPVGANGDVRVAVIGLNQKGAAHVQQLVGLPGARVVALCEVDPKILAREVELLKAKQLTVFATTDARALMDRSDVDAVVIASSDQWHALHTIWALQAGKDVYIEKPVCRTVWEGQRMLAAATKSGRIVQTGTQSRSDPGIAEAVHAVQSGRLGKIQWIHALCYRLREPIGRRLPWYPDWLDYDRFCGPTPMMPLVRGQLHYDWHWQWSTGGGDLANIGVHQLDIARWFAGDPPLPSRVMSFGGRYGVDDAGETPNTQLALYTFPDFPVYFEIRGLPEKPGVKAMDLVRGIREGVVVQCEHGYYAGYFGGGLYDNDGKRLSTIKGDGGEGHMANFLSAVRSRRAADLAAPLAGGFTSSVCCHFGNISYRAGRPASLDEIGRAVASQALAPELIAKMRRHLAVHGVDLGRTPFTLGPWLELDASTAGINAVSDGNPATLERVRFLLKETQRPPYLVPEVL